MKEKFLPKFQEYLPIIIGALFLFIIIVFGSFSIMIFYKGFYLDEFAKTGVYDALSEKYSINNTESVGLTKSITDNIFDFFHGKSELKYFTADEKSHMQDVKNLISAMNFMYYSSAILLMILLAYFYVKFKKQSMTFIEKLSKILSYGSIASLVIIIILFVVSIFYFEQFFILFHLLFFPQGNWMFEPTSLLITIFTSRFFLDITLRIAFYALFQSIIFLIIGLWLRKHVKLYKKYRG